METRTESIDSMVRTVERQLTKVISRNENSTLNQDNLVVSTTHGPVRGRQVAKVVAWRGIPYAAPPTGTRRFQRPREPERWTEILDASAHGASPIQPKVPAMLGGAGSGPLDEDSLTINVVRPATQWSTLRPVMVWIYGGAFSYGASTAYDGAELAVEGGVLVVTFNYRVGAFGFLDFTEYSTPAQSFDTNNGLRDQVAALKWVRNNISSFGGDPDNVTLFGESAGGISVTTLMCVPEAHGLFHRAIAQSSAPSTVFRRERTQEWAKQFVGFLGDTSAPVTARLIEATSAEILAATGKLTDLAPKEQPGTLSVAPTVDGDFLPIRPLEAFRDGSAARIPLIIGNNATEGRFFQLLARVQKKEALPTSKDSIEKMFALTDSHAQNRVLAAYPDYPSRASTAQIAGDIVFWYPSTVVADAHSRYAPTWVYRFDFASPIRRLLRLGATHAAEIDYVFGKVATRTGIKRILGGGTAATALSIRMMRTWLAFAISGGPGHEWPRYDTVSRPTLIFDRNLRVENDPRGTQRTAWDTYKNWDDK